MKMSLSLPEELKLIARQREFVNPSTCELRDYENGLQWLLLKDSQNGNEVSFNLLHYGFTVLVWERPDGREEDV